jgi:hypothetical protein
MLHSPNQSPAVAPSDEREVDPLGLWADDSLSDVEDAMSRLAVGTRLERSGHMVQEHLATGGKRLRSRLALSAIEAMGGTREHGVGWAAACELVHNATLIHDDLQDGDRVRRGNPTTWVRHGAAQAINAGDLLLMLPFLAIEAVPAEVTLVVGFCAGGPQSVRVVACTKELPEMKLLGKLKKDLWDEDNKVEPLALNVKKVEPTLLQAQQNEAKVAQSLDM